MATLNVGAGQAYTTLASAVAASRNGDVISVQAGTYVNDFVTISKDISIVGVGGMANFVATVAPPNGKGIFVTQSNVTIQNLSFSGAAVGDMNGAGIRYEGGNLVIIDSYFHHNQNGLLANNAPAGTIRITGSEFAYNGAGDGYSHNIYVNNIASLVIDDSYFHDASVGHQIKSRAQSTTITNSRIYDGTGTGSYSIDLPNGGVGVIRDNVIQQGANSDNPAIIHYGGESAAYAGSSLLIVDNVVVNDMSSSSARLLSNATTVAATVTNNGVYGLTTNQIVSGSAAVSGTTFLTAHPSLDTSAPWLDGGGSGGSGTISGTAGADTLAGTAGADTMAGLAGNDQYTVNDPGDVVIEANGAGTDTVLSSVSYSLAQNVENLTLTGSGNLNGTGNTLANVLSGNAGNNTLDGAAGADQMAGGAGNDTYIVDNAGDVVTEASGGGTDTVLSSVSYTLAQNVENLTLTGSGNINGTGNSLANVLSGNAGNNTLNGGGGNDTIDGGNGIDTAAFAGRRADYQIVRDGNSVSISRTGDSATLVNVEQFSFSDGIVSLDALGGSPPSGTIFGTAGADTLVGTAGADTMAGLAGNDVYTVNHAGDVVTEASGGGTDTVLSSVSYTLAQNVENLTLTGSGNINGTGSTLANVLSGNAGNNTLDGGAGADQMAGGAGNDSYRVDNAGDVVTEASGAGTDTVLSSVSYTLGQNVENLTLTGSGNINGTGNSLANVLTGNAGNNTLDGGRGSDTLTGGGGADSFVFHNSLRTSNIDTITDFNVAADTIRLENAVFTAITGTGTLTAAQFRANTSGTAADSSDHIIYETDTGKLFYDSNGNAAGGATQFALLSPGLALTNEDFFII